MVDSTNNNQRFAISRSQIVDRNNNQNEENEENVDDEAELSTQRRSASAPRPNVTSSNVANVSAVGPEKAAKAAAAVAAAAAAASSKNNNNGFNRMNCE